MVTRHELGGTTWVDLEEPTRDELSAVAREFNIDRRVEEEIATPTPHPGCAAFPSHLYLIIHFPAASGERRGARDQEIDIVIGKRFLVTARYELQPSMHKLHKIFEAEELLGGNQSEMTPDALLARVLSQLYQAIDHEVEYAAATLRRIEERIFSGEERAMVMAISEVGRSLLRFDTALAHQLEPLERFLISCTSPSFFGKGFASHAARIRRERDRAMTLVASARAIANELRETNQSLLSTRQNEIMKTLTVVSFIMLPLGLVANIFGMNAENIPIIGLKNDFWVILSIMLALSAVLTLFFLRKRWFS